jgi:uncharacterized protein YoaH (UPF0181 family)
MGQLTTRLLQRSSDAVVVVRVADAAILDANEAFLAATGYPRHELMGRSSHDLLVEVGAVDGPVAADALPAGPIAGGPVGIWSHSGALLAGQLSALRVELDEQEHAVCVIRGVRDPSAEERRLAAREALNRVLRSGVAWREATTTALAALGNCLRWEFGAMWLADAGSQRLRCAAVWHAPAAELEDVEQASWGAAFRPGEGLLGRVWSSGEPAWVSDASAGGDLARSRGGAGEPLGGWLGFPAWGPGGVVGVVELASRETRPPDEDLLRMSEQFGHVFGRLLGDVGPEDAGFPAEPPARFPETKQTPSETVSDVVQDLVGAVVAVTEALERQPVSSAGDQPRAVLGELAEGFAELNRRLEDVTASAADALPPPDPASPPAAGPAEFSLRLPTGLTLKAVSSRTGIPAATLRTWERRYGLLRPRRSPGGYRLYGQEEIARIEQIKYLLSQGVRTGAAMAAVIGAVRDAEEAATGEPAGGQPTPEPDEGDPDADDRPRGPRPRRRS